MKPLNENNIRIAYFEFLMQLVMLKIGGKVFLIILTIQSGRAMLFP